MRNTRESLQRMLDPASLIIFIGMIWLMAPVFFPALTEYRAYRDALGLTPYHSVEVRNQKVVSDGLIIDGIMVKRRCTFKSMEAYVVLPDTTSYRVDVDSFKDKRGNRAPSSSRQLWGPWKIPWTGTTPASWEISTEHICPDESLPQVNTFATGAWKDVP